MIREEPLRSPPSAPEARLRNQAERIGSGRSRQGWIAFDPAGRGAAFVAGLAGIVLPALIRGAAA